LTLRDLHVGWSWFMIIGNGVAGLWCLGAHRLPSLRTRALWWFTIAAEIAVFIQVVLGVTSFLPLGSLIVLFALPLGAYAATMAVRHYGDRSLAKGCASTIATHFLAGCLMAAGLAWLG
jgi:1,4-dihydroxy-2-naphthoate octaprenyltransferase